ncbi:alpha/beta hydrolase [Cryptosporangium minutisporangium]|uniref:alpha/beta hydrolase n=1 Tax=Cryptosporangium minutisporangium TaxID=113569 RepID=UPI0031EEB59B
MRAPRLPRRLLVAVATLTVAVFAGAGLAPVPSVAATGSGPYPALYETDRTLRNHTIYRPTDLATAPRLPIVVWGNGACRADGTWFENFLSEIASRGYLVVANGLPGGSGQTSASWLTQSIDWAVRENSRLGSKYRGKLDTTKIAVMGQSCGGLEAIEVSGDRRITTTVVWNSGLFGTGTKLALRNLTRPVAYLNGGPTDIAYANAVDDFGKLPASTPAFFGALNGAGHYGTFGQPNGGEFAVVGTAWLDWQLKGSQTAAAQFVGPACGLCQDADWEVRQRNLR